MLRIAICDDEILFTNKLETIINDIAQKHGIRLETDIFFDGLKLLSNIEDNNIRYDLIFLDIEMNDLNGLETARRIRKLDEIVFLIYVTNHTNYAIEAYEVHPFQFVVKPIDTNIISKYFYSAYEKIISGAFYFDYKSGKDHFKLLVNDIMYFESKKRTIIIYLSDGTQKMFYGKLNDIEKYLSESKNDFWRIHQSYLVNARYIVRKAFNHIELKYGTVLYISENRRQKINELYFRLVERDMVE